MFFRILPLLNKRLNHIVPVGIIYITGTPSGQGCLVAENLVSQTKLGRLGVTPGSRVEEGRGG